MRINKRLVYLLVMILCAINVSYGQYKSDSIQHLDEVVVTERRINKKIIPVQILGGKELERLNAHSVSDALRYFSGVQLKDYGGIGGLKTINVRSMGSQHVGVFFDGLEIGNAQNGVVDLGRYSLDNMESVSLYNGQKSAIFQPAKDFASASSVYMNTRKPKFDRKRNTNLSATFKTGSFGLLNPSVLWEQKISQRVKSSFNADYTYSDGKYKFRYKVVNKEDKRGGFDTTEIRKNGDINYLRLEHSLFGKMQGGEWKTKLYYYQSERGIPGAVVRETPGRYANEDRQWDNNFFVQASVKKKLTNTYSTLFSAKYAYDYLHYLSDPNKDEQIIVKVDNKYMLHEGYLSSANMFSIMPFWTINVSADVQWNKLNANLNEFIYPKRYSSWLAGATSLYFTRFKVQASMLATYIREDFKEEMKVRKNWERYTPALILSYKPFEQYDINLRAYYKKIFRMPTFNEIYYAVIGSGKSNLRPEYTTQYNVGITCGKSHTDSFVRGIEGQLDVYYNEVEDKILAKPGGQLFRWTMMNIGLVKIKGADMALSVRMSPAEKCNINVRMNYTYQKAQDYSNPQERLTYKGQISYIPEHSGSMILGGNYKSWDFNYSFIYSGERYTESANIERNKVLAWYTNDLALSKRLNWNGREIKLTAELNNLFNQQYEVVSRYPMPGTNMKFIVKAKF